MSGLVIEGLEASISGSAILTGVDLTVGSGEVHAVMGPNGSGKSTLAHVIAGRSCYDVTGGSVRLNGLELLGLPTWRRAEAGLFLTMQAPIEVPGVSLYGLAMSSKCVRIADNHQHRQVDVSGGTTGEDSAVNAQDAKQDARAAIDTAISERVREESQKIGFDERFLDRSVNVDLSGGERKLTEALQLGVLSPSVAVLDELDSGLDVDAVRLVARRVKKAVEDDGLGVLAISHYNRFFEYLKPDVVHIFIGGRICASGDAELTDIVEAEGYERWQADTDQPAGSEDAKSELFDDPFGDPFADRLI
ncbi:MAG: ATP-binding cassette domain-containing protein [Acidimicrobiaceae bacterium]|nr:ATP-binding cassette domain-containing protein [Acidimicrobiaceae bacterium]